MSLFVVTLALKMTLEVRQSFFRGQSFFFLQLQLFSVEGVLLVSRIFLLCFLIMVCRLSVQLYCVRWPGEVMPLRNLSFENKGYLLLILSYFVS